MPDADAARGMVDSLAQAVAQNRTALLALTALKNYDNYTFTHMVNVSILTMGQARGVGIDGPLLREFGLAALMHDIGKVKTPNEILNKPDKLTEQEYDILKRHTVDGAQILRKTPEMPTLGAGRRVRASPSRRRHRLPSAERRSSNLGDDAVRHRRRLRRDAVAARVSAGVSDRPHPRSAAAERRQAVRSASGPAIRAAGGHLSGRQLVRLDSGEIAVVLKAHAAGSVPAARAHPDDGGRYAAGEARRRQSVGSGGRHGQRHPGAARSGGIRNRSAVTTL